MHVHCSRLPLLPKSFRQISLPFCASRSRTHLLNSTYTCSLVLFPGLRQFHGALPLLPPSNDSQCSFSTMKGLTASRVYNAHWKLDTYFITLSLPDISILEISLKCGILHLSLADPPLYCIIIHCQQSSFHRESLSSLSYPLSSNRIHSTRFKIKFKGNFSQTKARQVILFRKEVSKTVFPAFSFATQRVTVQG